MEFAYWNGQIVPEREVVIPISDRGFLFGDGVFTTIKISEGKPELLTMHLDRLQSHCHLLHITPPILERTNVEDVIAANKLSQEAGRLKIIITGGDDNQLKLADRKFGHVLITLEPYSEQPFDNCRLCVFPSPVVRPISRLKTVAYLDRLWIKNYALNNGFYDALVTDENENVLETAFSNIFWIDDGKILSPHFSLPLLAGVTLEVIQAIAPSLGLHFEGVIKKIEEIPKTAQLFVCNAMQGIRPVDEIEEQHYPRDESVDAKLLNSYLEFVKNN